MKTYKWKITAFVVWVVITLIVVSVALRGVSKADTATNLISVAILLFWTLLWHLIKIWKSLMEVSRELHVPWGNIANCCIGTKYRHTAYGYKWSYKPINTL